MQITDEQKQWLDDNEDLMKTTTWHHYFHKKYNSILTPQQISDKIHNTAKAYAFYKLGIRFK